MNYLQLVNRARSECGVSSAPYTTLVGVSSAEGQRFINWVQDAWNDIQVIHEDWDFLRQTFSFNTNTVTPQASYTPAQTIPAGDFASYKRDSFRCAQANDSPALVDEMIFNFMPWDQFRNLWVYGQMRYNYQRPVAYSIDPQQNFWVGPIADTSGYTIDGEYYQTPQVLVNDTDIPVIPVRYHMAIVYEAMKKYAAYESAPEVLDRAKEGYTLIMKPLELARLPIPGLGPPLA